MASIVASIVISKFLHYTILVTISTRTSSKKNFNLMWTRIQCGLDLGCCWMLFFTIEKDRLACPCYGKEIQATTCWWRLIFLPNLPRVFEEKSLAKIWSGHMVGLGGFLGKHMEWETHIEAAKFQTYTTTQLQKGLTTLNVAFILSFLKFLSFLFEGLKFDMKEK